MEGGNWGNILNGVNLGDSLACGSDGTSHTGREIALLLFSGARAALSRQREHFQRTAHAPQTFDGLTEVHVGNMAGSMEQKMSNEIWIYEPAVV